MLASAAGDTSSPNEGADSGDASAGVQRWTWATAIGLLAPSALCAAIGLAGTGRRALWADEAYTALAATKSWLDLFTLVTQANDAVHALYYGLMHVFLQVFGVSALTLRAPSVICMSVACLGVTVIGWRMATLRTGLWAGFVFALLPVTMDYSTEARSYALSVALATWTSWAFGRQLTAARATAWGWLLYGALLTLTGLIFMYGWLIVAAHFTTLLFAGSRRVSLAKAWIPTVVISGLLLSPLWWLAERQAGQVAWITRDTVGSLEALGTYMFDRSASTLWWPFLGFVALMVWGTWFVLRRGEPKERLLLLLAWPWSLLPGLLLIAVSLFKPTFTDRYILFTAPAAALLLGVALKELSWIWRSLAVGTLVVIAMLSFTWIFTPVGRDGWGLKTDILRNSAGSGDVILFSPDAYSNVARVAGLPPGLREISLTDLQERVNRGAGGPSTLWVVPFACILPEDVAALKEMGYERADEGVGNCSVEPFVRH